MYFALIDVESTGLSCEYQELTEISVLNCQNLEQVLWEIKIKHPERCSKEALLVTHKTAQELASRGRYIEEVIPEINDFLSNITKDPDDLCIIAHNASFDRRFVEHFWKKLDYTFPANYWLDTLSMSKRFVKQILNINTKTSFALSNMLKLAGIKEKPGAHQSLVDVQNTYCLYMYMKSRGMSNSEFIKLSPSLIENISAKKITKTGRKTKIDDKEVSNVMMAMESDTSSIEYVDENDD